MTTDYPPIDPPDLSKAIEAHERWHRSGGSEGTRLRLHHVNLQSATLSGRCLVKAEFVDVDLRQANLQGTDFTFAVLDHVALARASIQGSRLHLATLTASDLSAADLSGADMSGSIVTDANLQEALLHKTRLIKCNWSRNQLQHTQLHLADATGAEFVRCNFHSADWSDATLMGGAFLYCDLRNTCFSRACLDNVSFHGSFIAGIHGPAFKLRGLRGDWVQFSPSGPDSVRQPIQILVDVLRSERVVPEIWGQIC
jgi:uncharacterized protein YjbI with pentapeptide repeats